MDPNGGANRRGMDVPVRGLQALRGFASLTVTPQTERWQYQLDGETDEKVEPDAFFFFFLHQTLLLCKKIKWLTVPSQGQDLSALEVRAQASYPPTASTSREEKFLKTEKPRDSIGCRKRLMSKRTPNISQTHQTRPFQLSEILELLM